MSDVGSTQPSSSLGVASLTIPQGPGTGMWELCFCIFFPCFEVEICTQNLSSQSTCFSYLLDLWQLCLNVVLSDSRKNLFEMHETHKNSAQKLKPVNRLLHRKNSVKKKTVSSLLTQFFGRVLLLRYFFLKRNILFLRGIVWKRRKLGTHQIQ